MPFWRRKRTLSERLADSAEALRDQLTERLSSLSHELGQRSTGLREQLAEHSEELREQLLRGQRRSSSLLPGRLPQLSWPQLSQASELSEQLRRRTQASRSWLTHQGSGLGADLRQRSGRTQKQLAQQAARVLEQLPIQQAAQRRKRSRPATIAGALLGGLAGATLGALAVASRLGQDVAPLDRSLDAEPKIFQWRGWRLVYYVQGQGEPLVLVHSINAAASAYELRAPFARLGDQHTVYALDLLGFGASERPNVRYSTDLYVDLLSDFLREVSGPAHVLAVSLSGSYAVAAAARSPELVKSLVLVNPTGLVTLAQQQSAPGRLLERLLRLPVIGEGLFNLLVSRLSLQKHARKVYSHPAYVDNQLIEHHYHTSHQPNARYAPAAFMGGMLALHISTPLRELRVPALVVWSGYNGYQHTAREREAFRRTNSKLRVAELRESGALPFDEQREDFERLLRDWLREHARPGTQEQHQSQSVGE